MIWKIKNKARKTALLVLLSLSVSTSAFPLKIAGIDTLNTAILIRDLRFGRDIVSENIDKPLIPASVMKSITVASLLNLIDPAEQFVTPIVAKGEIIDDELIGNIEVQVCGDPTIESQYFPSSRGFADSIASGVKRMGVTKVKGDVVINESRFPDATTPKGWMAGDLIWPYGTRLHAANYKDNRFRLSLPSKQTEPHVPDLQFNFTGGKGGMKISRQDGSETFTVSGRMKKAVSDNYATPYPAKVMRHEILEALKKADVEVEGQILGNDLKTYALIYEHKSPQMGYIMKSLMHRSDNLFAEGMLRALTPEGTRDDALKEEQAVWTLAAIPQHDIKIFDGSGLSRNNRLTARFISDVFQYMLPEYGEDYYSLFPKAGYEGTMRNFLSGTSLEKKVAMKTGSMNGVQGFAGFLFDDYGYPTHVIIFLVNNFKCSRQDLKNEIQRLLLEKFDVSLQNNTSDAEE